MKQLSLILILFIFSSIGFAQTNANLTKAQDFYNDNKFKKAEKFAEKAMNDEESKVEATILYAYAIIAQSKVTEGVDVLVSAHEGDVENIMYLTSLGHLTMMMQDYKKASSYFSLALKYETVDSNRCAHYTNRAACKLRMRKMEGAFKDLSKALEIDSMNFSANNDMGIVAKYLKKDSVAESCLKRVIQVKPEDHLGYANLGWFYQERKRFDEALVLLNKAIEINPDFAYAYNNRSMVKLDMGDFEGAYADVNHSLKLDGTNSYAYKNLGIILFKDGKKEEACSAWKTALALGFTEQYGRTVSELIKHNCGSE